MLRCAFHIMTRITIMFNERSSQSKTAKGPYLCTLCIRLRNFVVGSFLLFFIPIEQGSIWKRILYKQHTTAMRKGVHSMKSPPQSTPTTFHSDVWYARVCYYYCYSCCCRHRRRCCYCCLTVVEQRCALVPRMKTFSRMNMCHSLLGREIEHTHFDVAVLQLILKTVQTQLNDKINIW